MATRALAATHHDIDVNTRLGKTTIHYLEAGDKSKPTLLLLMGFPSSSTQYLDFIPLMADEYHVLAPDYPGFGLTKAPETFDYTFDNIAAVVSDWLKALGISSYAMYVFDYGAPVGFCLALEDSAAVKAIITQNGNAYEAGFGRDFWKLVFDLWESENSQEAREVVRENVLTRATTNYQYYHGVPDTDRSLVDPEQPVRDYLQNLAGRKNQERQIDLFYDYRTNPQMYPRWQQYMRDSQVPLLAVWGKGDPAFIPAGAEAYKTDLPDAEIHLLDAGHFALETKRWEIAELSKAFLVKVRF